MKTKNISIICISLLFMILLSACASSRNADEDKLRRMGLRIISSEISVGSAQGTQSDQQTINYRFTLKNIGDEDLRISAVEPVFVPDLAGRIQEPALQKVGLELVSGQSREVQGQVRFDSHGLTKDTINSWGQLITDVHVTIEKTLHIPGK